MMSEKYIQNYSNWCWAVACKMVGEQYKTMNPIYNFTLGYNKDIEWQNCLCNGSSFDIDVAKEIDVWQAAIVMNANTIMPGTIGNFPGDDEAKIRGIKYVVTGECNSKKIDVMNLGTYDMQENLLDQYGEEIKTVFRNKNYIIGNAVLSPWNVCHSFVLMDISDNMVKVYDPWNGTIDMYNIQDVFERGFISAKGIGVIKWIQFINCGIE